MTSEEPIDQETIDQEEVIARLNDLNKESFDLPKTQPTDNKLIIDMTIEELRDALIQTIAVNKKIHDDHISYTRRIEEIWGNKKKIKQRYLELKDRIKVKR